MDSSEEDEECAEEEERLGIYKHEPGYQSGYHRAISFTQKAQRPRRIGLRKRNQWRINENKSIFSMRGYRYGYRLLFELPGVREYARSLKRLPLPNTCDKNNQHNGVMPAMPGELFLSGKQAATLLEKAADVPYISWDQLKRISNCLSYLHTLMTGFNGENWDDVSQVWDGLKERNFPTKHGTMIPEHIPSIPAMKKAFNREWHPSCGMPYTLWLTGFLSAWAWAVYGCRSRSDMKSIKTSETHHFSKDQKWACTDFKGGRNKLHEKKAGTRPWSIWYICLCPGGVHRAPPKRFEKCIDPKTGNPTMRPRFCTVCPLNVLEIKRRLMKKGIKFRVFAKYAVKYKSFAVRNHGDIPAMAIDWFAAQDALDDNKRYDSHAGRRACARWLQEVHAPYHEGFELHGDLYDSWINYQPNCMKSNFCRRQQSKDPHVATAALRRFAFMLGRGARAEKKGMDLGTKLMLGLLESNGQALLAEQIVQRHNQVNGEEKTQTF